MPSLVTDAARASIGRRTSALFASAAAYRLACNRRRRRRHSAGVVVYAAVVVVCATCLRVAVAAEFDQSGFRNVLGVRDVTEM